MYFSYHFRTVAINVYLAIILSLTSVAVSLQMFSRPNTNSLQILL